MYVKTIEKTAFKIQACTTQLMTTLWSHLKTHPHGVNP